MKAFDLPRAMPFIVSLMLGLSLPGLALAQVCNVRVVTDANPDYSGMESMIYSVTSNITRQCSRSPF